MMGHIYLRVGDIGWAKLFYVDLLGFDWSVLIGWAKARNNNNKPNRFY